MLRYAIANIPAQAYPHPFLGQQQQPAPAHRPPLLPKPIVNAGIVALGIMMSTIGYYNRKTDLGVIAMGAGSSIVGAGIVLLVLDFAGFDTSTNGA